MAVNGGGDDAGRSGGDGRRRHRVNAFFMDDFANLSTYAQQNRMRFSSTLINTEK